MPLTKQMQAALSLRKFEAFFIEISQRIFKPGQPPYFTGCVVQSKSESRAGCMPTMSRHSTEHGKAVQVQAGKGYKRSNERNSNTNGRSLTTNSILLSNMDVQAVCTAFAQWQDGSGCTRKATCQD